MEEPNRLGFVGSNAHTHTVDAVERSQLHNLNELKINRLSISEVNADEIQLHGFADASQSAYDACFYIRTRNATGNYKIQLLISKSRVAPIKAVSLPRLELCAAVLLARLQEKVINSINIPKLRNFLWTDSTITLSWIKAFSRKWTIPSQSCWRSAKIDKGRRLETC